MPLGPGVLFRKRLLLMSLRGSHDAGQPGTGKSLRGVHFYTEKFYFPQVILTEAFYHFKIRSRKIPEGSLILHFPRIA